MLDPVLIQQGAAAIVVGLLSWKVVHSTYNLYFSPLARFPGPTCAALSTWWKTYVELVQGKSLARELIELHARYGDIVRIGPNELHFAKASAYHEVYNAKNRWDKDAALYMPFADEASTLTVLEYPAAKQRRDVILPLFSRKSIISMQYLIQESIDKLCEKIAEQSKADKSISIFQGIRCAVLDTMFSFCFARELNALDAPGFDAEIERSMHEAVPGIPVFKHLPFLKVILGMIPSSIVTAMQPALTGYFNMRGMLDAQVDEILANPDSLQSLSHPIIYHHLLNPQKGKVPSALSLKDEALLLVNAGVDTVSNALIMGVVCTLENAEVYGKLKQELREAWPKLEEKPKYEDLESLPYLKAVIKEALRLSHGVVAPMGRIVPSEGARISDEFIPAGTIVGVSNIVVHYDEKLFPEPYKFNPERWLNSSSESLENWLVSFAKGPRSCLGINLAWCDLYITMGNLFRRFDMQLDGSSSSDLEWVDCYMTHFHQGKIMIRATPCSA